MRVLYSLFLEYKTLTKYTLHKDYLMNVNLHLNGVG
jgi:hypothetical protein